MIYCNWVSIHYLWVLSPEKTLHDPTCAMVKTCYVEPRSSQWIVTISLKGKDSPCFDHGTYVHIYIHTHTPSYTYIYIYIHIYIYVYIYIYMYTICILYMYTVYICTHPVLSIYPPHLYPSGRPSHWEVPCSPAPLWSWSHLAAPHPFFSISWFRWPASYCISVDRNHIHQNMYVVYMYICTYICGYIQTKRNPSKRHRKW